MFSGRLLDIQLASCCVWNPVIKVFLPHTVSNYIPIELRKKIHDRSDLFGLGVDRASIHAGGSIDCFWHEILKRIILTLSATAINDQLIF